MLFTSILTNIPHHNLKHCLNEVLSSQAPQRTHKDLASSMLPLVCSPPPFFHSQLPPTPCQASEAYCWTIQSACFLFTGPSPVYTLHILLASSKVWVSTSQRWNLPLDSQTQARGLLQWRKLAYNCCSSHFRIPAKQNLVHGAHVASDWAHSSGPSDCLAQCSVDKG